MTDNESWAVEGGRASASRIRQDLDEMASSVREMEAFTQFSSDLDEVTKKQLKYGQGLMRLLRQEQYKPFSQHQMVILLIAALNHTMEDIPIDELLDYREKLLAAVEAQHDHICRRIDRNGKLLDRDKADILASAQEFAARWLRGGHGEEAPDGER